MHGLDTVPRPSTLTSLDKVPRSSVFLDTVPLPSAMICLDKMPRLSECLGTVPQPITMPRNGASA